MTTPSVDPTAALVLIDLQNGILSLPTVTPSAEILARGSALADAFRAAGRPVVLVNVGWSPDGGDMLSARTAVGGSAMPPGPGFDEFPAELGAQPSDIRVTKRQWGAFYGTELDLQLRRRGVTQIVLAGISTSIGVESTARAAWEHGYDLLIVEDATTDTDPDAHANSFTRIFPRIAQLATTDAVLAAA